MSTITRPVPMTLPPPADVYRITVDQYDRMVGCGALGEDDPIELLNGVLVRKMPKDPRHPTSTRRCYRALERVLAAGWHARKEDPIRIPDYDEPEPDVAVVRGEDTAYVGRHPGPAEVALLAEVAEATLTRDRTLKLRTYALAGIPVYWIVNLVDGQVEVYSDPDRDTGTYRSRVDYRPGQDIPVLIDGQEVGRIAVAELLPPRP
jgi:Uma2 family endonuclease